MVLDLRRASYFVVDKVGSVFWSALTGKCGADAAITALATEYEVSPDLLTHDLAAFERQCLADGLLVPGPPANVGMAPIAANAADRSALYCLVATARSLTRDGLQGVYQRCQLLRASGSRLGTENAIRRFRFAENFYVSSRAPQDCLARSLALFRFLQAHGIQAEHVIGVRRVPFLAHAWVEIDGNPLLGAKTGGFQPIARIRAGEPSGAK